MLINIIALLLFIVKLEKQLIVLILQSKQKD
jgi:hypothetical protein